MELLYGRLNLNEAEWRISKVNQGLSICETYPRLVIVPSLISDKMLMESALFRYNHRFPILSYFNSRNKVLS